MQRIFRLGLIATCVFGAVVPALRAQEPVAGAVSAAPAAFVVSGRVKTGEAWTAAKLEAEFGKEAKTVSYRSKDKKKHKSRCVRLWDVLSRAGFTPADPARKNPLLTLAITVIGADGYAAAFSYAELSPDYGKRDVYIALDEDCKPYPNGAVAILSINDGKPSRWVHDFRQLLVSDTLSPTQPAN